MKVNVELNILGNEISLEISAPEEFEEWSNFKQMEYIESEIIDKTDYTWDY